MKKQQIKEDQDIIKVEKKDNFLKKIDTFNDLSWEKGYKLIIDFCHADIKLDLNEIKKILYLENKDLIDLFLREYILFDDRDKTYLEFFINNNLHHTNTEFVSDLIYFANDLSLNINYLLVLEIIKKYPNDEHYIVLGAISYISNNIKYYYIKEIVDSFELVINSKKYFQSEQILASITLYRIMKKKSYLNFVAELIEADKTNLIFIRNLFKEESYQMKYFDLSEIKAKIPLLFKIK